MMSGDMDVENVYPSYWSVIPAEVRYDKRLSPRSVILYSEITALTQASGVCWATNRYFAELYGVSDRTIKTCIKELVDCGYLVSEIKRDDKTREVVRRNLYTTNVVKNSSLPSEENFPTPSEENFPTPSEENFPKNNTRISFNNTSKNNKENIFSKENISKKNEIYQTIIGYLNEKLGNGKYSWKTNSTQKLINGRLDDGYTVDDFKRVIDVKANDWLNDAKWRQYLRPQTLFTPGHFENYLNQTPTKKVGHDALQEFLNS
jgi:uncharacterized phage protein (TIGR02220 family)